MPLAYRHRFGLALGGAVVAAGIAVLPAAPATAAAATVTFNGSCGLLGLLAAASKPDQASVSVPAGSAVTFVNGLPEAAELRLDNQPSGTVAKGGKITKAFQHGPVEVALVPDCLLDQLTAVTPVTVTVTSGQTPGAGQPTGQQAQPNRPGPNPPAQAGGGQAPQRGLPQRDGVPGAGAAPVASFVEPGGALPQDSTDAVESLPPLVGAAEPGPAGRHGASSVLIAVAVASIVVAGIAAIRALLAKRAARAVGA